MGRAGLGWNAWTGLDCIGIGMGLGLEVEWCWDDEMLLLQYGMEYGGMEHTVVAAWDVTGSDGT